MTFKEFFKHCKFDFWESYYSGIPYVTVTFEGDFCEYQRSQSIHKKLYFEDRETAKKLVAKSLYEELTAVGEINDFRKVFKACTFEFYEDKDCGKYYVQAYFSNPGKLRSWCHLREVPKSIYLDKDKAKELVADSFYWSLLSKGELEYDS